MLRPCLIVSAAILALLTACSGADPVETAPARASAPQTPTTTPTSPSASASTAAPTVSATAAAEPVEGQVLAAGVISSDEEEYRVSFSPDGTVAYFARGSGFFPQTRQATILESRLVDGEWSEPTVASFSGEYPDIDPWVSPDGASLYFSSIRPIDGAARDDAELFRVDRDGDGWGSPVHLASLGSDADELGASVSADGLIVFASNRAGGFGGWDLYAAEPADGAFSEPAPIAELNTPAWEFNPAISTDGSLLVFTSIDRPGGRGLGDLFLATRAGDAWSEVGPLRVNTSADEYHAAWSPDGETLYFVRRSGDGNLYAAPWNAVAPGD